MNQKYPHIELLLDNVLRYPGDLTYDNAAEVIARYKGPENPKANDPHGEALHKELVALLQQADETFIAVTGEPGSQDREFGVPELSKLRQMFAAYINEIDKTK